MDDIRLLLGDSLEILPTLEAGSADAICTDPPAGISFCGAKWDSFGSNHNPESDYHLVENGRRHERGTMAGTRGLTIQASQKARDHFVDFLSAVLRECLRVLKPGGYAFVWALPRTSHWTATAIEDAGFEVRDRIAHIQGQGFPKGKGCLKPAVEDWWLARKPGPKVLPLPGLDECRVGLNGEEPYSYPNGPGGSDPNHMWRGRAKGNGKEPVAGNVAGRWPPNLCLTHSALCERVGVKKVQAGNGNNGKPFARNAPKGWSGWDNQENSRGHVYSDADGLETVEDWVCHPECPVFLLGEQSGESKSGGYPPAGGKRSHVATYSEHTTARGEPIFGPSTGTSARFFPQFHWSAADDVPFLYQPKAGRSERWFYCRDCEDAFPPEARQEHLHGHYRDDKEDWSHLVGHPTQKPLALVSWLVRLVAGPGELVLDPLMGSGTTALACLREGRRFIGVEQDEEYYAISLARLQAEQAATPLFPT